MDIKDCLRTFVDNFIQSNHDEATDALNSAITLKTREIVNQEIDADVLEEPEKETEQPE